MRSLRSCDPCGGCVPARTSTSWKWMPSTASTSSCPGLDQRDATLDWLEHLGVNKAAAKNLMIAFSFGSSFANWSSQTLEQDVKVGNVVNWLNGYQDAVSQLHMACWRSLSADTRTGSICKCGS